MALAMQAFPSLGEGAVVELMRRLVVNDLLGNPDAHLKNFGVLYPDGVAPRLAPAYDIVAYAAMQGVEGHGLPLMPATRGAPPVPRTALFAPPRLRAFCFAAGLNEPLVRRTVAETVRAARAAWPTMITASSLPPPWQARLLQRLERHALVQGLSRRGT